MQSSGLWEQRYGISAPPVWPAAAGFTLSLGIVALATAVGPDAHGFALPALALAAAVCSWTARLVVAVVVGGISWLFDNGFVLGTLGQLHWHGFADALSLTLLLAVALLSARTGRRRRVASRTRQDAAWNC